MMTMTDTKLGVANTIIATREAANVIVCELDGGNALLKRFASATHQLSEPADRLALSRQSDPTMGEAKQRASGVLCHSYSGVCTLSSFRLSYRSAP